MCIYIAAYIYLCIYFFLASNYLPTYLFSVGSVSLETPENTCTRTQIHTYIYKYIHEAPRQAQWIHMVGTWDSQKSHKHHSQVTLMLSGLWSHTRSSPFLCPDQRLVDQVFLGCPPGAAAPSGVGATGKAVCSFLLLPFFRAHLPEQFMWCVLYGGSRETV